MACPAAASTPRPASRFLCVCGGGGGGGSDAKRCGGGASERRTGRQMSHARHLHIAQWRSRVLGLVACRVQKDAQPSTEASPATPELQRCGDGDGGGGGGGRGSGGETQWPHAAHLPASGREASGRKARALVARAVQGPRVQGPLKVDAPLEFEPCFAYRRWRSPRACRSSGTPASQGRRGASACKPPGRQTEGPARQPACRAPALARRRQAERGLRPLLPSAPGCGARQCEPSRRPL